MKSIALYLLLCCSLPICAQQPSREDIQRYNDILLQQPGDGNLKVVAYNALSNDYILYGVGILGPAYESLLKYSGARSLNNKYTFANILVALSNTTACGDDIFNYLDANDIKKYPPCAASIYKYVQNFLTQVDTGTFNQMDMLGYLIDIQTISHDFPDEDMGIYLSRYGATISQVMLDRYLTYLVQTHRTPARSWGYMQTEAGLYFYLNYFQQRDTFLPDGYQGWLYPTALIAHNQAPDMTAADWTDYQHQILLVIENRIGNNTLGPIDGSMIAASLKYIKDDVRTYLTALAKTPGYSKLVVGQINQVLSVL